MTMLSNLFNRPYVIPLGLSLVISSLFYQGMIGFEYLSLTLWLAFLASFSNYRELLSGKSYSTVAELWIFLFMMWCAMSYFWSHTPGVALLNINLFIIFLFSIHIGRNIESEQMPEFLNLITILCSILAIYSLYQYFVLDVHKPASLFLNPNINATFLNFALLPLGARFLYDNRSRFCWKPITVVPILLLFSVSVLISSRGALLALAVGALFLLIYFRQYLSFKPLLAMIMVLLLIFSGINSFQERGIASRLAEMSEQRGLDSVSGSRLRIWKPAAMLVRENPLQGVGIGGFWPSYQSIRPANDSSSGAYAHNDYLQILVELGVVGLLLFMLFWFSLIRHTGKRLFTTPVTSESAHRSGIFAALLALLTHAFFSFPFFVTGSLTVSGLYVGILINRLPTHGWPHITRLSRILSLCILILFAYLASALFIAERMLNTAKTADTTDEAMATIARAESVFPYWDQPALHYAFYVSRATHTERALLEKREVIDFILRKLRDGLKYFPQRPENYYFQAEMMRHAVPPYPSDNIIANYQRALDVDPAYLPARNSLAHYFSTSLKQPLRALEVLEQGWGRYYYMESNTLLAYTQLLYQLRSRHNGSVPLSDIKRVQNTITFRMQEFKKQGYDNIKDSLTLQ